MRGSPARPPVPPACRQRGRGTWRLSNQGMVTIRWIGTTRSRRSNSGVTPGKRPAALARRARWAALARRRWSCACAATLVRRSRLHTHRSPRRRWLVCPCAIVCAVERWIEVQSANAGGSSHTLGRRYVPLPPGDWPLDACCMRGRACASGGLPRQKPGGREAPSDREMRSLRWPTRDWVSSLAVTVRTRDALALSVSRAV